jgi:ADP-glucose pyrophosphorylase
LRPQYEKGENMCGLTMQVMPHIASMGIYVVKADVMRKLLMTAYPSANDFGSEIIPGAVDLGMRVQAYLYEGYWEDIGTIGAFYQSNLDLVKEKPNFSFYDKDAPIYTMSRFLPPSRFNVCSSWRCRALCSSMPTGTRPAPATMSSPSATCLAVCSGT